MNKRTVLIPIFSLASMAVGGGVNAMNVAPPEPLTAEVVGQPGTAIDFSLALMDQGGDTLDDVATYSSMASDAIGEFDIDQAVIYAQMSADSYGDLEALIPTLPGSITPLGQASYTAMTTCHLAWQWTHDILNRMDVAAMGDTTLLDACSDALEVATAMISP